jgi:hypothetical protein
LGNATPDVNKAFESQSLRWTMFKHSRITIIYNPYSTISQNERDRLLSSELAAELAAVVTGSGNAALTNGCFRFG